ncbi:FUSC family protein [Camelimonas abortus]|uniref:FUSC family protein n=1 Tax=Camelimonas abortus TaxID=1017184 RepID=UPI0035E6F338
MADAVAPQGARYAWTKALLGMRPAVWPTGPSVRAAISVGAPFVAGALSGDIVAFMWLGMGALMCVTGEGDGDYRSRARRLAVAAPLGALGFFAGYLDALPPAGVALAMAGAGVLAGVVSAMGPALSIGMLQALLVAAIAIGAPVPAPYFQPAALYLAGAFWHLALLAAEALLRDRAQQRAAAAQLLQALATLARVRASGVRDAAAARRAVAMQLSAAWRAPPDGRMLRAGALRDADALFARITAETAPATLAPQAQRLEEAADAVMAGRCGRRDLARLLEELAGDARWPAPQDAPQRPIPWPAPDAAVLQSAAALGLCLGIAYACRLVVDASHWFWIPLTVGLVMKPDLGSVFARAIQRCIGTSAGVVIGAVLLWLTPRGAGFGAVIGLLAAALPWAMARSYALQAVFLTPLVLMLVDLIVPGPQSADYAGQRFVDTLAGGAIVLLVGYFPWPRSHSRQDAAAFDRVRAALAACLRALAGTGPDPALARAAAWAAICDCRARLGAALAEPPPASAEAATWLAAVDSAERIFDAIAACPPGAVRPEDAPALAALARQAQDGLTERPSPPPGATPAVAALFARVVAACAHIDRLTGRARGAAATP